LLQCPWSGTNGHQPTPPTVLPAQQQPVNMGQSRHCTRKTHNDLQSERPHRQSLAAVAGCTHLHYPAAVCNLTTAPSTSLLDFDWVQTYACEPHQVPLRNVCQRSRQACVELIGSALTLSHCCRGNEEIASRWASQ